MPKENWPVSTDVKKYIRLTYETVSLRELITECKNLWPNASFEDIDISAENIKVRGCSCHHDYGDYEEFLIFTCNKKHPGPKKGRDDWMPDPWASPYLALEIP